MSGDNEVERRVPEILQDLPWALKYKNIHFPKYKHRSELGDIESRNYEQLSIFEVSTHNNQ